MTQLTVFLMDEGRMLIAYDGGLTREAQLEMTHAFKEWRATRKGTVVIADAVVRDLRSFEVEIEIAALDARVVETSDDAHAAWVLARAFADEQA